MVPTRSPRVKICCIRDLDEAWTAIRAGASALGLVSAMPSGPGPIAEERIAEIAAQVPPPIATFLLTSLQDVGEIAAQHRRCRTHTIQLVDRLTSGTHRELRRALPGIALVQVVHVTGEESIDEACSVAAEVDALLLDSGYEGREVKELGGTGRTHDWRLSRRIREAVAVPIFLAGGLKPGNVAEAVRQVEPFGVDLCTGVRTDGHLDGDKLRRFMGQVRNGYPDSVEIRPATPEDSGVLTEIAHTAKRHWGYPERYIEAWREELTITPGFVAAHPVFAACRDGAIVGCCALVVEGGKASVEHMWVQPGEIGGGLGRRLFDRVVAEARERGASELEIVSDPHAAGFYEHMGARRTGEQVSELEGRPRVLPIYTLALG